MEIVNTIPDELIQEAKRIEDDPEKILALIDLLFMYDDGKRLPS